MAKFHRRTERQRISEMETDGRGPIRRRINSLTIKLEPFDKSLTHEEAVHVRNVIESLLQDYFFTVQPWVVRSETENSFSDSTDIAVEGIGDEGSIASDRSIMNQSGSVTYVGLAQILENKQTEDLTGVEITMNGLVYFAEGSENIPDEDELLWTMAQQALGNSEAVVDALRDFFPAQQPLVVTVETPIFTPATIAPVESAPTAAETPTSEMVPFPTTDDPDAFVLSASKQPANDWEDEHFQSDSNVVLGVTTDGVQSFDGEKSSRKTIMLGGSVGIGLLFLGTLVGLFAVQRSRKRAVAYRTNQVDHADEGGEYLVDTGELGLSLSQEDWKANSNSPKHKDDDADVDKIEEAARRAPVSLPVVIPTEDPGAESPPTINPISYLSTIFQRKSPVAEQHLESPSKILSEEGDNETRQKSAQELNMSVYQFTDDGSSDFSDVVSIQPRVVSLKSLESFEEQHTSMTRQDYVVQKGQLGSPFEETPISILGEIGLRAKATRSETPTNAGTVESLKTAPALPDILTGESDISRGTPSYSSSSTSSREPQHQQLQQVASGAASILDDLEREEEKEAQKEDQRIRYSMMPNPYVRRRQGKGDRSAPCVLKETEITASSLARASGINNGNNASILSSSSSSSDEAEKPTNNALGMIPKIAAPSWWSMSPEQDGLKNNDRTRRTRNGRSSPAVKEAFKEEDMAYSGDEENTFGVPESDGWDPADTTFSSMGEAPDQDDIKMVEFQVGKVTPPQSPSENKIKQSPPGNKYHSPVKVPSPSSRKNIEVAKSVLQRMKSSPERDNSGHKLGESITSVTSDTGSEEIRFDSSMEI